MAIPFVRRGGAPATTKATQQAPLSSQGPNAEQQLSRRVPAQGASGHQSQDSVSSTSIAPTKTSSALMAQPKTVGWLSDVPSSSAKNTQSQPHPTAALTLARPASCLRTDPGTTVRVEALGVLHFKVNPWFVSEAEAKERMDRVQNFKGRLADQGLQWICLNFLDDVVLVGRKNTGMGRDKG